MVSVETEVQLGVVVTNIRLGISPVERKGRLGLLFFGTAARPFAVELRKRVSRVFLIVRSFLP
jgi:hypothetical protein